MDAVALCLQAHARAEESMDSPSAEALCMAHVAQAFITWTDVQTTSGSTSAALIHVT